MFGQFRVKYAPKYIQLRLLPKLARQRENRYVLLTSNYFKIQISIKFAMTKRSLSSMNNCNFVIGSKRIRSNVEQIIDNISIESTLKCDITFQDNDCNYSTIRGPEVACFHSDNVD